MSNEIDKLISKAKDLHTNDIQTIICSLQIEIDERKDINVENKTKSRVSK